MNITNLKRAFNYMLENVKPEEFTMGTHLTDTQGLDIVELPISRPCSTIGCVIEKCAEKFHSTGDKDLHYLIWSEVFFDLKYTDDAYAFMFYGQWAKHPEADTLEQTLLRMKYVIDFGEVPLTFSQELASLRLLFVDGFGKEFTPFSFNYLMSSQTLTLKKYEHH